MANSKITELSVAAAISGGESFYGLVGTNDAKISPTQLAKYTIENYHYNTTAQDENTISGAINKLDVVGSDISSLLLEMRPIGSLYWSSQNISPASLFGGTWTQITDKFVLAAGDAYAVGSSGGEATHTLTVAEMPSHNHGGASGGPSNNISNGPSVTSTGNNSVGHTHSIPTLSGRAPSSGTEGNHVHTTYNRRDTYSSGTAGTYFSSVPNAAASSYIYTTSKGAHTHTATTNASNTEAGDAHTHSMAHTHNLASHTHTITSQGGGAAHNNMPPYIAKFCWERTA